MTAPIPTDEPENAENLDLALVAAARELAIEAHASINQHYDGWPYSRHLTQVAAAANTWRHLLPAAEQSAALAGAWVHDVLEDVSSISYNDLRHKLSPDIAEISYLLATPKGRNRAERHNQAYYQEMSTHRVATFVKLADRLANVAYSVEGRNARMLGIYQQEAAHFARFLRPAWPELAPMWAQLDALLNT